MHQPTVATRFDPADIPLEQRTLAPILALRAREDGERPFLTVAQRTFTFAETHQLAHQLANGLHAAGLRRGRHLAIMLPNCGEMVFAWFACALLGAVNVPLNPALRSAMLEKPLRDARAEFLVIHREFLPALESIAPELRARLKWVAVLGGIAGARLPSGPAEYLEVPTLFREGPAAALEADFRDVQTVFYTSGTTGPAKGVQTLNGQTFSAASGMIRAVGLTSDDVVFTPYPLFHGFAARLGVLPSLMAGARVFVGEKFSASRYWEQAAGCGATVAHLLPGATRILLEQPPGAWDRAHRVRAIFNTKVVPEFEARFGTRLVEAFSMTETGFVLYTRWPDRRPGSVGRAHEDWEVDLVDEFDLPVQVGTPGALVVRPRLPYIMMQGYLNQPEATVPVFRNLWFHTGDVMRCDADGYYYFLDRARERIRRRGENISSFDVEQAVLTHPGIADCAVLPYPAADGQDDVRLVAVREPGHAVTAAQVCDWLLSRLPPSMIPRYVEFVAELPKTATGKVEKVKMIQAGLQAGHWDRESGHDQGSGHA